MLALLAFGLAWLSFAVVEMPLRRASWDPMRTRPALGAAQLLALPLFLAIVLLGSLRLVQLTSEDAFVPLAFRDLPSVNDWGEATERCHHRYARADRGDLLEHCLGRRTQRPTLFLFGDSHAQQFSFTAEAALRTAPQRFAELRYVHNGGVPVLIDRGTLPEEAEFLLRQASEGDLVVFTFYRGKLRGGRRLSEAGAALLDDDAVRARMERLQRALLELADALAARGVRLVLVHDGPRLGLNVRATSCLVGERLTGRDPCAVDAARSLADRRPMDVVFEQVTAARPNVHRFDYHGLLCSERCAVRRADGSLMMIDHNHLSRAAATSVGPAFARFLQGLP